MDLANESQQWEARKTYLLWENGAAVWLCECEALLMLQLVRRGCPGTWSGDWAAELPVTEGSPCAGAKELPRISSQRAVWEIIAHEITGGLQGTAERSNHRAAQGTGWCCPGAEAAQESQGLVSGCVAAQERKALRTLEVQLPFLPWCHLSRACGSPCSWATAVPGRSSITLPSPVPSHRSASPQTQK